MKKFCLFLLLVSSLNTSSKKEISTAQYPDRITFKGTEYKLHVNPLESYFQKFPDKKPTRGIRSTALWRGYIGYFEIIDKQLFVTDIKIEISDKDAEGKRVKKWISVYKEVFPESDKTLVKDYSGILILPYGKLKSYVHLAYGTTYSDYWLMEVENGKVNEIRNYDNKEFVQFKKDQFEVFKKTQKYKDLFNELKEDDDTDKEIENFIYQYITEYITHFLKE